MLTALACAAAACGRHEGGGDSIVLLRLSPPRATIDMVTDLPLRVVGIAASGEIVAAHDLEWSVDSGTLTIDGDHAILTPGAGGSTVTVSSEDLSEQAIVTVLQPGLSTMNVRDAWTDLPIAGATVTVSTASAITAADGYAVVNGDFSGPVTVSVEAPGYVRAQVVGLRLRNASIPLTPVTPLAAAEMRGVIDFSALDEPEPGQLVIAFAGGAARDAMALGLETIISPATRNVDVAGFTLPLPTNLEIFGFTSDYSAPLERAPQAAFVFGGPIWLSDAFDLVASGPTDGATLLAELRFAFGEFGQGQELSPPLPVGGVVSPVGMRPDRAGLEKLSLSMPDAPAGEDAPLVIVAADLGDRLLPVGIAAPDSDRGTATIRYRPSPPSPAHAGLVIAVVASEGGLRPDSPQRVISLARVAEGASRASPPPFFSPESLDSFVTSEATGVFSFPQPAPADVTVHSLEIAGVRADVFSAIEAGSFTLAPGAVTSWESRAVALSSLTFDALFVPGAATPAERYADDAGGGLITRR